MIPGGGVRVESRVRAPGNCGLGPQSREGQGPNYRTGPGGVEPPERTQSPGSRMLSEFPPNSGNRDEKCLPLGAERG